MGDISVLRVRLAFDLGAGAIPIFELQMTRIWKVGGLTIGIFGNVESAQDHDGFCLIIPTNGFKWWVGGMSQPVNHHCVKPTTRAARRKQTHS